MSFQDLTERVLGNAIRLQGEPVTYGPSASSFEVRGIFSSGDRRSVDGQAPIRVEVPNLGVRLSDFETPPEIGDPLVIRTTNYTVTEVAKDGEGGATLYLRLV